MSKQELALIKLGHGGVSGHVANAHATITMYDTRLAPYYERLIEGGYAIDITMIPDDVLVPASLNGPLLDTTLADGEVDACPMPSEVLVAGLGGAFLGLAALKVARPGWGGLDSVSLSAYVAYWRGKGASVGQRKGGVIVWDDGHVEPFVTM